jgi:thiamine biosynthesis lipoprotein
MELDLGGIGKEYAVDRAATMLAEAGIGAALVNLGGDLRAIGRRADGNPWRLGIAHPRNTGAVLASIPLHEGALATSGDYERFFELDGRRYCHILDPRTGWPVHAWQSISVVAPACLAAGTITTIAMLLGEQTLPFLRSQGLPFLAVDSLGRVVDERGTLD